MQVAAYSAMLKLQQRHWWSRGMSRFYRAALYHFLSSPIPLQQQPRKILDVGCGFGANLPLLNEFGSVVGIDISLSALQYIKTQNELSTPCLVQARADALPFRPETFD